MAHTTDIYPALRVRNADIIPLIIHTTHDTSSTYVFINSHENAINISPGIRDINGSFIEVNDTVLIDSVPYILKFTAYTFMFEAISPGISDTVLIDTAITRDLKIIDRDTIGPDAAIFLRLPGKADTNAHNIHIEQIMILSSDIIEESDRGIYATLNPNISDYRLASIYRTSDNSFIYEGKRFHHNGTIYRASFQHGFFIAINDDTNKEPGPIIEMVDSNTLTIPGSISID